jgi:hypothetical protein
MTERREKAPPTQRDRALRGLLAAVGLAAALALAALAR